MFAARFVSRRFVTEVTLCIFSTAVFFIVLGMLYRSFWHVDIIVGSINDPAGTAQLMRELEALDIDYRVQKDGTVVIDGNERSGLLESGIAPQSFRVQPHLLEQTLLVVLLSLSLLSALYTGRKIMPKPEAPRAAEVQADPPPVVQMPAAAAVPLSDPLFTKLFEREHPQAIAVYLLGRSPEEAAAGMEALPVPVRTQVWERMACSGACDTALKARLFELFAQKRKRLQTRLRPPEATQKMVAIYRRLPPAVREGLLTALRREHAADELLALLAAEETAKADRGEA